MIIDCHVHAGELGKHYPEWWVAELYRHWGGIHQWTYERPNLSVGERLLSQMNQVGVDMMCIMTSDHRRVFPNDSGPYTPNDYLLEVKKVAPERFALTCSVDPFRGVADGVKEIERCVKEHGFQACKLYPSYDHFDPGDEHLFPIYKKLVELEIPMQIHMGYTPSRNAPMKYQLPHLLDPVGEKFPELKVIVAHMAWPWTEECMSLISRWENFHCDVAYWGWFGAERVLRKIRDFGDICGFDRLLYGSENSHTHMAPDMFRSFKTLAPKLGIKPITDEEMDLIMWKNTARLWKLNPKPHSQKAKGK